MSSNVTKIIQTSLLLLGLLLAYPSAAKTLDDILPLWQQHGLAKALADKDHPQVQQKAVFFWLSFADEVETINEWARHVRVILSYCRSFDCNVSVPLLDKHYPLPPSFNPRLLTFLQDNHSKTYDATHIKVKKPLAQFQVHQENPLDKKFWLSILRSDEPELQRLLLQHLHKQSQLSASIIEAIVQYLTRHEYDDPKYLTEWIRLLAPQAEVSQKVLDALLIFLANDDIFVQAAVIDVIHQQQQQRIDEIFIDKLNQMLKAKPNKDIAQLILQVFLDQENIPLSLLQQHTDYFNDSEQWSLALTLVQIIAKQNYLTPRLSQLIHQLLNYHNPYVQWAAFNAILQHEQTDKIPPQKQQQMLRLPLNLSPNLLPCVAKGLENKENLVSYNSFVSVYYALDSHYPTLDHTLKNTAVTCVKQRLEDNNAYIQQHTLFLAKQRSHAYPFLATLFEQSLNNVSYPSIRLFALQTLVDNPLDEDQETLLLTNLTSENSKIRQISIDALRQEEFRREEIFLMLLGHLLTLETKATKTQTNSEIQTDLRFLYHLLAGDTPAWSTLFLWFTQADKTFNGSSKFSHKMFTEKLTQLLIYWQKSADFSVLRDKIVHIVAMLLKKETWTAEEQSQAIVSLKPILDAANKANQNQDRRINYQPLHNNLQVIDQKINQQASKHWLKKALIIAVIWILHLLLWFILLRLATINTWIHRHIVWHPIVRHAVGLGYIDLLLPRLGIAQALILAPFKQTFMQNVTEESLACEQTFIESAPSFLYSQYSDHMTLYLASDQVENSIEYTILSHFPDYTYALGNRRFLLTTIRQGGLDIVFTDSTQLSGHLLNQFLQTCHKPRLITLKQTEHA